MTPEQIDDYCRRLAEAWKKAPDYSLYGLIYDAHDLTFTIDCHENETEQETHEALITAIERMVSDGNKD